MLVSSLVLSRVGGKYFNGLKGTMLNQGLSKGVLVFCVCVIGQ
jgi:hypothetical protein